MASICKHWCRYAAFKLQEPDVLRAMAIKVLILQDLRSQYNQHLICVSTPWVANAAFHLIQAFIKKNVSFLLFSSLSQACLLARFWCPMLIAGGSIPSGRIRRHGGGDSRPGSGVQLTHSRCSLLGSRWSPVGTVAGKSFCLNPSYTSDFLSL